MNGFLRTIAPILGETLKESLEVTLLVLLMMSLVEAFDTFSGGRIFRGLRRSGRGQILVSGLLGSIPGCAGGFAAVSNASITRSASHTASCVVSAMVKRFLISATCSGMSVSLPRLMY